MQTWQLNQTIDLSRPAPAPLRETPMVVGDALSHAWCVTVLRGGAPVPLTGVRVLGQFVRADGKTVCVEGHARDNIASVVLSAECFAAEGLLRGFLRAVDGERTVTLSETLLRVTSDGGGEMLDSGNALPSLRALSEQIQTLTAQSEEDRQRMALLETRADAFVRFGAQNINTAVLWEGAVNGAGAEMPLTVNALEFDELLVDYNIGSEGTAVFPVEKGMTPTLRMTDIADAPTTAISLRIAEMRLKLRADGAALAVTGASYMKWNGGSSEKATYGTAAQGNSTSPAGVITRILGRKTVESAETADVRTDIDGTVHESAGAAVRAQMTAGREEDARLSALWRTADTPWNIEKLLRALLPRVTAEGSPARLTLTADTPVTVTAAPGTRVFLGGRNLYDGEETLFAQTETDAPQLLTALSRLPDGPALLSARPSAAPCGIEVLFENGRAAADTIGADGRLCLLIARDIASQGAVRAVRLYGARFTEIMLECADTFTAYASCRGVRSGITGADGICTLPALDGENTIFSPETAVKAEGLGVTSSRECIV